MISSAPVADHPPSPAGRLFWASAVAGWAVIGVGVAGLLSEPAKTRPSEAARFVLGAALVHDLVVAPVVVLIGLAVARAAPARVRAVVQGAVLVSGLVALFSVPFVRGYGRVAPNPSILPGNYATGLATVLGLVWAVAAAVLVVRLRPSRRRRG